MLASEFWNSILPEVTSIKKCETFRQKIHNAFEHRTSEFPVIMRSWLSFYSSFFKYLFIHSDRNTYENFSLQVGNFRLFFIYASSPKDDEHDVSNMVKNQLKKSRNISDDIDLLQRIENFFGELYNLAASCGCEFNKRSDWASFYQNLDIEEVLNIFEKHGFKRMYELLDDSATEESENDDIEEEDEDMDFGEYVFDELQDDFIKILNKYMPHIRSLEDFNSIAWVSLLEGYDDKSWDTNGLLETSYLTLKEDFIKQSFGKNVELDQHVYYNTAIHILHVLCMDEMVEKILELCRHILTLSTEDQQTVVEKGSLDLTEEQSKLIKFFFEDLTGFAKESLDAVTDLHKELHGTQEGNYGAIFFFQKRLFANKQILLSLKDAVMEMMPAILL